jgi:hypothetical protein
MEDVEEQGHGVSDSLASPEFAYEAAMGQRGTKRTRNGESLMRDVPEWAVDTRGITKGIAASQGPAKLREPDTLIVETERVLDQLFKSDYTGTRSDAFFDDAAHDLLKVWDEHGQLSSGEVTADTFGPQDDRNVIGKANFIASLLLQLHHPAATQVPQEEAHLSLSLRSLRAGDQQRNVYMPKILFEWLNEHHDPAGDMLAGVLEYQRGYALAPDFWDCIYSCIFRGRFGQAIQILEGANFPAADQYSDREIENMQSVIDRTCEFVAKCPALKNDDWNMKGSAWKFYRQQAERGLAALRDFVEGGMPGSDDLAGFNKSGRRNQPTLSTASRRAELEFPYEIYESLQEVYKLLMGNQEDLGKSAFDWLEATMGLTAWWDGEDGPVPSGSLARSRQSVNRMQHSRPVDVTPALAYRQRLAATLAQVLDEGDLKQTFDASDPLHIALASVLQSDVDSALTIMKGWSITITAATAELADAAGWLHSSRPGSRGAMRGLDQSDLMVLSYGSESVSNRTSIKDEILVEYAGLLASKPQIQTSIQGLPLEGWQLALTILARVDDVQAVDSKANSILDKIPLDSTERVDALLDLCADLSFTSYSTKIAEVSSSNLLLSNTILTSPQTEIRRPAQLQQLKLRLRNPVLRPRPQHRQSQANPQRPHLPQPDPIARLPALLPTRRLSNRISRLPKNLPRTTRLGGRRRRQNPLLLPLRLRDLAQFLRPPRLPIRRLDDEQEALCPALSHRRYNISIRVHIRRAFRPVHRRRHPHRHTPSAPRRSPPLPQQPRALSEQ